MLAMSSKYALRALLILAECPQEEFVQVVHLAKAADVPGPYLSKVMKTLAREGIIESRRGARGGVRLAANRLPLNFFDVCLALNDPATNSKCVLSGGACSARRPCPQHGRWLRVRGQIHEFLKQARVEKGKKLALK